jgi:CBS domain-containing membrane protein
MGMKAPKLRVVDLMTTAVITANASETIKEAHADMQVGVIRHLPVLDDRRRLVGLLSDRDVLRALGAKKSGRVADFMTREVVTIRPEAQAHEAASLMLDLKIGSLPVVDDEGTLVGVVTQTDFLEVARRALLGLPLER